MTTTTRAVDLITPPTTLSPRSDQPWLWLGHDLGWVLVATDTADGVPGRLDLAEDPARAILADLDRALDDAWTRVAGTDTHPGGEQLKHYWTKNPEGLAQWVTKTHRWTALYHILLKHMDGNEALAKATASRWFHDTLGYWPGHQAGLNPTGPG